MQELLDSAALELFQTAKRKGLVIGFAESCTAGLCSAALASIPGSSEILAGSIVSYMLSVKDHVLGVDPGILYDAKLGPVSRECAERMAMGARDALGCDVAVSVTGIAGPGGAEEGKPVGTVWFACMYQNKIITKLEHLSGSRNEIRVQAACMALKLAREAIMETDFPK